jgi:hypothetical protein
MKRPERNLRTTSMLRANATAIHRVSLLSLVGILAFCGCNKTPPAETNAPPAAASPAPDQAAAGNAAAPAAPAAQPTPAPTPPPPPQPKVYTVPSGTTLAVRIGQELSSKTANVGDAFNGSLAQSVRVQGVTVLKAGAPVTGTVVAARKQGKFKGEGELGLQLSRVGSYGVTTQEYEQTVKGKGKRTATMVGGGAGGGALIGGLAGGGKGALIGGLVGAGAGTAGAALTGNKGVTIPAETVVSFVSSSPITVTMKPKSAEESAPE